MQIIGLSRELTAPPNTLVLVTDEDVPYEVLKQIYYGNLSFEAQGRFLTVRIPPNSTEHFTKTSVAELNLRLEEAHKKIRDRAAAHENALNTLAKRAGLPLI